MNLRFDQPWWFIGLAICLPMAWAALHWFVAMTAARRWSAIILRTALVAALLAMLAGASMIRRSDRVAVIACVDMSGSVHRFFDASAIGKGSEDKPLTFSEVVRTFLESHAVSRRPDDLAGVVLFGASPSATGMVQPGPGAAGFSLPKEWPPIEEATDIEQALRLAAAMIPPDAAGRIVLFSDGVQTRGTALAAATELAGRKSGANSTQSHRPIRVDVVPLEYHVEHEVIVESVDSPPTAQSGATVAVRVVLTATERCTGTLDLQREDRAVDINGDAPGSSLRLTLEPGRNVEVFKVPLPEGRVHRFTALWTPDNDPAGHPIGDTVASNNRADSVTVAPGRGAVLIVDGVSGGDSQGAGSILGTTLARSGMEVKSVGPDALPSDLLWLQQFDLIILQNVAAEAMPRPVHGALATCITQLGVGLIMVGGPDSFGAGGWKGTEIEPLLPVKLDLPEKLVTPAAAVILVIDNSGSMNRSVMGSSRSQQDIADEGAALAVESMDKTDLVGVITFNSDFTVDVPLGPNTNPKATAKLIRAIGADGGTNMPPALREAHKQIRSAKADIKHVIILSDGASQGRNALPGIVEDMAAGDIIVSTIAIGNDADITNMRDLARLGRGQFYQVIDPTMLPRVLLKAVRIVRSPLVREGRFLPVTLPTGSPAMEGVAGAFGGDIAPLNGLILTQARTDLTVIYPLATPKVPGKDSGGEPVLGYWSAGLGRVAAFTSDAHAKWGREWLSTSDGKGYARFWTQLARAIARPPSSRTQEMTAEIEGDRMTVRLRASDDNGRPMDGLTVPGTIYAPAGGKRDLRLAQVGPGEYEEVVTLSSIPARSDNAASSPDATGSGPYVLTFAPRSGTNTSSSPQSNAIPPVIGGVTRPPGEEYRRLRSDRAALTAIAEATGGSVLDIAATSAAPGTTKHDLFSRAGIVPAEARTPLWPWLAIASVSLMLLDVATRRVAWDRLLSREMGAELGRGVSAALRDRTSSASAAVGRLREAEPIASPSSPASIAAPLGDSDADAVRESERARRQEARRNALRARRDSSEKEAESSQPSQSSASPTPASAAPSPPANANPDPFASPAADIPPSPPEESSLQAAKRRARRKMED